MRALLLLALAACATAEPEPTPERPAVVCWQDRCEVARDFLFAMKSALNECLEREAATVPQKVVRR